MLSLSNVDDFLSRIDVDMETKDITKDSFGDLITVFDADMDFTVMKEAVMSNRYMRDKIVDSGVLYVEVNDVIYVDGNKTSVSILVEKGNNGFGTSLKIMVKHVDVSINGEIKSFLSFESLKSYISRNVNSIDFK